MNEASPKLGFYAAIVAFIAAVAWRGADRADSQYRKLSDCTDRPDVNGSGRGN
jgi:hypothetical protein